MARLKPFDSEDWLAYAGCEYKRPEIAYWESLIHESITLVLDGDRVEIAVDGDPFFMKEFTCVAAAARFAAEVARFRPHSVLIEVLWPENCNNF